MAELSEFIKATGLTQLDPELLEQALTHGSLDNRRSKQVNYQRLEFLGDRVLGLVIAETLYTRHPSLDEGALSARLNQLVSRATCAKVARNMNLPPLIRMGKQARDDGGRDSDNILGDVVESIIGAIYLDLGLDAANSFIIGQWDGQFDDSRQSDKHPKSALLEWAAANRRKAPEYIVTSRDGPDHAPTFTITARIANVGEAQGSGTNKQEAEKAAAAALLQILDQKK